ncbi:hypothetical protein ACI394_28440, partial [Klebsiella pneumoniae]
ARLESAGLAQAGVEEPFHRISDVRRWLCYAAQTLLLLPIYAVAGLQWFFPYIAYTRLADQVDRVPALLLSGISFVFIPPLAMCASILIKWL